MAATPGREAGPAVGVSPVPGSSPAVGPVATEGLQDFARMLSLFTRCSKLKVRRPAPEPVVWASWLLQWLWIWVQWAACRVTRHISCTVCTHNFENMQRLAV